MGFMNFAIFLRNRFYKAWKNHQVEFFQVRVFANITHYDINADYGDYVDYVDYVITD